MNRGSSSRARRPFGDYFPEWIESYSGLTSRGFSETTRPEYRRPIDAYAMPVWKGKRLGDIQRADVRRLFMTMRGDGKSTSVIKKLRMALSALFETAIEDELVHRNPAKGVRIPAPLSEEAESDERAKALTRQDLAALLAELSPAIAALLRVPHPHRAADLGGDRAHLAPSRSGREAPRQGARAGLPRQAQEAEDSQGPSVGTTLIPGKVAKNVLWPAAPAANLVLEINDEESEPFPVTFHTFRHTCASLLFEDGRNIKQLQEWLGHADPGFTLRTYVHLMDAGVGDAEFFDAAVRPRDGD